MASIILLRLKNNITDRRRRLFRKSKYSVYVINPVGISMDFSDEKFYNCSFRADAFQAVGALPLEAADPPQRRRHM
ncbi:MAG: hypothetical protein SGI91_20065 [Alphaproteobacteria bacterium]|nr:hypothetical protein [Alphaproteobacteria bacterium]